MKKCDGKSVTDRTDRHTDRRTDRQTTENDPLVSPLLTAGDTKKLFFGGKGGKIVNSINLVVRCREYFVLFS